MDPIAPTNAGASLMLETHAHGMLTVQGVIYDLDGTLVESRLNFAMLKQRLGCPRECDLLKFVDDLPSPRSRASAHQMIREHEHQDAQQAGWLPGAKGLVDYLSDRQIPQAIVTRNSQQAAQIKLQRNRIPIQHVITRDDAPPKPDPSGLLSIASCWRVQMSSVLYIGDYLYDLQAARNAGMIACLYAPEARPDYADLADLVVNDYDRLRAMLN